LGVWLKTLAEGVQIGEMTKGSAAQKAGLQTGDRLASLNGAGIRSMADLMLMLGQHKPGEKVAMTVQREGKAKLLPFNVTLQ
jgi:S1-C subfamily serine protease